MINAPSGRTPEKAPRWDLMGTEGCGGGIRFSWMLLLVWGYVDIYRKKEGTGGQTWGPQGRGAPCRGAPPTLVTASFVPWSRVQVSWITFSEKITFPKVLFRLDFLRNTEIGKKTAIWTGPLG